MPQAAIPSPVLGWNTRDTVAAMRPGFAPIFDNMVVENGAPRVRFGHRAWATGLPGRVDGLLPWDGAGASPRLFAASGTGIYDISSGGAVGAAAVTGLTSARWSGINVSAPGTNTLFVFNGADTPRTFDGTTWATWTGTGVTGGVAWANQTGGRLFVGNPGRLSFFYGGAGAISGAFTEFSLQGIAQRGGGVCAMGVLSGDGGSGPQALSVFLTTEGEALVYAGTDPSSVSAWGFVGRWLLPRPVGAPHRNIAAFGGDILAMTEAGVVPLSALRDGSPVFTVLEQAGPMRRIAPTWRQTARERGTASGWQIVSLRRPMLTVVNVPWSATTAQQYVLSEGGAVSRWGGVNAAVWAEGLGGRVFAGDSSSAGRVFLYGEDETDLGFGIRWEAISAFDVMRAPSRVKRGQLVQPVMRDATAVSLTTQVLSDWQMPLPQMDALGAGAAAPSIPPALGGTVLVWDVGAWDAAVWGGGDGVVSRQWTSAAAVGHALAVHLRGVSGAGRPMWLGSNMTYEAGGPMR